MKSWFLYVLKCENDLCEKYGIEKVVGGKKLRLGK
jgi:hypothetical protein